MDRKKINAAAILKGFRDNEKENTPALLRGLTKNKVKENYFVGLVLI
jgi:hypothetical protein